MISSTSRHNGSRIGTATHPGSPYRGKHHVPHGTLGRFLEARVPPHSGVGVGAEKCSRRCNHRSPRELFESCSRTLTSIDVVTSGRLWSNPDLKIHSGGVASYATYCCVIYPEDHPRRTSTNCVGKAAPPAVIRRACCCSLSVSLSPSHTHIADTIKTKTFRHYSILVH